VISKSYSIIFNDFIIYLESDEALNPTADVMSLPTERKWTEEIPENNEIEIVVPTHEDRVFVKLNTIDQKWINENKDTFISYSCSEGLLQNNYELKLIL
jgi:hypothetical protein